MGFSIFDIRHFWRLPFHFTLLVVAATTPKVLHLYSHISSLPPLLYLLYLPTFLALDVLNVFLFWALIHATARGWLSVPLSFILGILGLCILGVSSSWISFYLETGGEVKWGAARNLAKDLDGLRVLLSGSVRALVAAIAMIAVARLISIPFYNAIDSLVYNAVKAFTGRRFGTGRLSEEAPESLSSNIGVGYDALSSEDDDEEEQGTSCSDLEEACHTRRWRRKQLSLWITRTKFLAPLITVLILLIVRPRHFPFAHLSGSIPYTLVEIWTGNAAEVCQAGFSEDFPRFPLPDLLDSDFWEPATATFPGWHPTGFPFDNQSVYYLQRPSWLPEEEMKGFGRWYNESEVGNMGDGGIMNEGIFMGINYDPRKDPLKISNQDQNLVESIATTLKNHKVSIKHVVILSLESTRKDVFPFKKDSHLHHKILESYSSEKNRAKASSELSKLTQNAEMLTGEKSGFGEGDLDFSSARPGSWRNLRKHMGGINVLGALTGSTSSLKSILGSHCGVQPLPVDFTVEVNQQIYQPCLPNVLDLLNQNKYTKGMMQRSKDVTSMPWKSTYLASMTDQYDHQDELNQHMGFDQVVVRDTLSDPSSEHFPPTEKESNYFGYPETQLKPYLMDLFREAAEQDHRVFLSHFTSSTHHPWNTPEAFGDTVDYLRQSHWGGEHPLNRYLNTIKYIDGWIGEVMDVLEEMEVAEESLVVMVGDHGMAFEEDSPVRGTFENGHISNLRVPLLFHHPSLPRMQLELNATSMSIIPTVLDLLKETGSLNEEDKSIASNLIHQYEGQSLIRPFVPERNGRQQWNVGVLNAGGAVLSVSSAAVPYHLVLPVCKNGVYRFTDLSRDPHEQTPLEENDIDGLIRAVAKKYRVSINERPAKWVSEAEKVGNWWGVEMRRRWRYGGAALQGDRRPEEMAGLGKVKKEHWWETK